jgi:RNA polymerase subunit RPABC4/transcription elongation factor Spt4
MGKPALQKAGTKEVTHMSTRPAPVCGEHRVTKEWRSTVFEYCEEGISVRVPNVHAWVCPVNEEASFTPELVDDLLVTIREFLNTAKRSRERRSELTEYIIAVG